MLAFGGVVTSELLKWYFLQIFSLALATEDTFSRLCTFLESQELIGVFSNAFVET